MFAFCSFHVLKDLKRDGFQSIKAFLIQKNALILNGFAFEPGHYLQQKLLLSFLYLKKKHLRLAVNGSKFDQNID